MKYSTSYSSALDLLSFIFFIVSIMILCFPLCFLGDSEIAFSNYEEIAKLKKDWPTIQKVVDETKSDGKITHNEYYKIVHAANQAKLDKVKNEL